MKKVLSMVAVIAFAGTIVLDANQASARGHKAEVLRPYRGSDRPLDLDLHGGFSWWGSGLATGARFGIPVVQNGFVRTINNAVYLNFGADFYYIHLRHTRNHDSGYYPGLGFPITMHWEFYFTSKFSLFGELGINVFLHPWLFADNDFEWAPWWHWTVIATGGRFRFNDHFGIVFRVGCPYAAFGVTFSF